MRQAHGRARNIEVGKASVWVAGKSSRMHLYEALDVLGKKVMNRPRENGVSKSVGRLVMYCALSRLENIAPSANDVLTFILR